MNNEHVSPTEEGKNASLQSERKGTIVPIRAMKANRGIRGIAPLFLNLGTRRR
jgi:hypothetical protein